MKVGVANLPLHYGKAPRWLFERMKILSRELTLAIVSQFGPDEMLKKMADPFWFQAFGCVLGFDWHSSGLTTTVCGALKEGLKEIRKDLGFFVCGGKGETALSTPQEIKTAIENFSLPLKIENLTSASRMSAKVDNTALQDGYNLYHHTFLFTSNGSWVVIQQGMNTKTRWARRYHWLSSNLQSFVCEPHYAICSDFQGKTLNMVALESENSRKASVLLSREKPEKIIKEIKKVQTLNLPRHHAIFFKNLKKESLKKVLLKTYEEVPENFESLLKIKGVGTKTIRALALLAELIYGVTPSTKDPAKYSFAHGGKDGYPYPLDKKCYDQTIEIFKIALQEAKIGRNEKLAAIKRLSNYY